MSTDQADRPLATEQLEQRVQAMFPIDMAPERFAAEDGYGWLGFIFGDYRYRNAELDAWIQRVGEILRTPQLLEQCRQQYLTEEERARLRYIENDLEDLDG